MIQHYNKEETHTGIKKYTIKIQREEGLYIEWANGK